MQLVQKIAIEHAKQKMLFAQTLSTRAIREAKLLKRLHNAPRQERERICGLLTGAKMAVLQAEIAHRRALEELHTELPITHKAVSRGVPLHAKRPAKGPASEEKTYRFEQKHP